MREVDNIHETKNNGESQCNEYQDQRVVGSIKQGNGDIAHNLQSEVGVQDIGIIDQLSRGH